MKIVMVIYQVGLLMNTPIVELPEVGTTLQECQLMKDIGAPNAGLWLLQNGYADEIDRGELKIEIECVERELTPEEIAAEAAERKKKTEEQASSNAQMQAFQNEQQAWMDKRIGEYRAMYPENASNPKWDEKMRLKVGEEASFFRSTNMEFPNTINGSKISLRTIEIAHHLYLSRNSLQSNARICLGLVSKWTA